MSASSERLLATPVGSLTIVASRDGLVEVRLPSEIERALQRVEYEDAGGRDDAGGFLAEAAAQLEAYFSGRRRDFALTLTPAGTPFQQAVWRAVARIPYGETRSYGEIARELGRPTAARAVGRAVGLNPLPIVVPCHRVVGSDGRLTGFAGGLPMKAQLLALERTGGDEPGHDGASRGVPSAVEAAAASARV